MVNGRAPGAIATGDVSSVELVCGSIQARIGFVPFNSPAKAAQVFSAMSDTAYVSSYLSGSSSNAWTRWLEQIQRPAVNTPLALTQPPLAETPQLPPSTRSLAPAILLPPPAPQLPLAPPPTWPPPPAPPVEKIVSEEFVTGISVAVGVVTTVTAAVASATTIIAAVATAIAATAAVAVTTTTAAGTSVIMTVAAAAQQGLVAQQASAAQPVSSAMRQAVTAGLKAPALAQQGQHLQSIARGGGPSIFNTLDQMQAVGSSGALAPFDMASFRAVAGSMDWTLQLPLPFWDMTSGWHARCSLLLGMAQDWC
jgi:hypothetical protein